MEPVEPVLKNIYQSNTYRKDLSWPHFDDEPRVQEKLQKYCKDLLFWVLWACLIMATKNDGICFKETLILIFMQKIKFMPYLFLPKILRLCYFGYFRHAWPLHTKTMRFSWRTFDAYYTSFLRYYTSANSHGFAVKYMTMWCFILDYFKEKLKTK